MISKRELENDESENPTKKTKHSILPDNIVSMIMGRFYYSSLESILATMNSHTSAKQQSALVTKSVIPAQPSTENTC